MHTDCDSHARQSRGALDTALHCPGTAHLRDISDRQNGADSKLPGSVKAWQESVSTDGCLSLIGLVARQNSNEQPEGLAGEQHSCDYSNEPVGNIDDR